MKSFCTVPLLGRLGNTLFGASAGLAYSMDHDLRFSMPTETTDEFWKPAYLGHLADPEIEEARKSPHVRQIAIKEESYRYAPLAWKKRWAEDHIVTLLGFRQSPRYFNHHREAILAKMGFPWVDACSNFVATHIRRGDAVRHDHKHFLQSREWIEEQMSKFYRRDFAFFSDDPLWCFENFGARKDCIIGTPFSKTYFDDLMLDKREEVADLVAMSLCADFILSASTFAWFGAWLSRNPNKRVIMPDKWLVPGWDGTTEETWSDLYLPGYEKA